MLSAHVRHVCASSPVRSLMTRCHHSDARLSGHCLDSKLTFKVAVQAQESFQCSRPAQLEGMMSQTGKPPTDSSVCMDLPPWFHTNTETSIDGSPRLQVYPGVLDNLVKSSDPPTRSQSLSSSLAQASLITITQPSITFTSRLRWENIWRHVIHWLPLSRPAIFLTAKS